MGCKVGQQVQLEVVRLAKDGGKPQVRKVKLRLCDEQDLVSVKE